MLTSPAVNATRNDLRFANIYVEVESDSRKACFQFTRPLDESGGVRHGDYVRFGPGRVLVIASSGPSIH